MKTFLICLPLAVTMTALAADTIDGFSLVRTVDGITEYRLEANGLRVLMLPQPGVPTATFMVTYHVGSRNEVTGTTGATHLLEHLMFKGTAQHHRGLGTSYDQVLERVGAEINATTWLDRTNYFATVPANALALPIELEADRMRNLSLLEEDRRPEMTVVRNEFELGENHPPNALATELWAAAFFAHPYHHNTIGWRSDIENVPIEKLRAFYDTFYWPNNATATVIGGFDVKPTLQLIKDHFGKIPTAPHPLPQLYTEEPEQSGQRRVQLKRAGELGVVMLAHKIPAATHADWPAIEVLSRILTHGDTSRCFRALTDENLTLDVEGSASFTHDPSLHILTAELSEDAKHEAVEHALVAEIEKLQKDGVTADEVKTAIAGFVAQRAFSRDGTFALAAEINECIAVGDWTLYLTLDDKIKAVTPADVQRVAQRYFIENHSTVGWFVPVEGGSGVTASGKQDHFEPKQVIAPAPPKAPLAPPIATDYAKRIQRSTIHGADVLVCPTNAQGIALLRVSLPIGEACETNRALAHLTADMLERGTTKHDKFAIADLLEKAGVDIESKVSAETFDLTAKCLAKDLPMVLDLLVEQWRMPLFAKDEFAKAKKEFASVLQQELESTEEQAAISFSQAIFANGHPLHRATIEEMTAFNKAATLAQVKAFHAAHCSPMGARLVIVGDVVTKDVNAQLSALFDGWNSGSPCPTLLEVLSSRGARDIAVPMADKPSVSVLLGQDTYVLATDPDWLPLRLAVDALGSGFTSRLVGNVRDREGLTYHIGSNVIDEGRYAGVWSTAASFAPTMLDKGIASTRQQIEAWWQDGISADELAFRQTAIAGEFTVNLETLHGLAEQILACVRRGVGIEWIDAYPTKLRALTLEDVNRVIKQRCDPTKLVLVKAGVAK